MVYNNKLAEKVNEYIRSEAHVAVKYRLNLLINRLSDECITSASMNSKDAFAKANLIEGVRLSIKVTEHLARELMEKTLDADAILGVIENKTDGDRKWELKKKLTLLQRLLGKKKLPQKKQQT